MNNPELDHLALALTRSPMMMGVAVKVFFANLVISALICIDAHTWWGIPLFIVIHLLAVKLSIKEPDFFIIYTKALMKTPPILNRLHWGGTNSYEAW